MVSELEDINQYLGVGINQVKGWCIPHLWQAIWPLYQKIGKGSVAEIGVFEGKFLIGLAKTFGADMPHAAIDVFNMQRFNLNKAGVGKREAVLENLAAHGVAPENVTCYKRDSLTLNVQDTMHMRRKFEGFKFFSVDGCHEVLHTMNDIEFAMSVMDPAGIIAVDDYHSPDWPGVVEAVSKMYLLREFTFVPLLYTCGKLFLCSRSYLDEYRDHVKAYVKENFPETRMKEVTRFGYKTLNMKPNQASWKDIV
ncbi:MAG: class I SAM-dependent methyltransferase [Paracoccaceae bacterium]|nr:class I SAM-dependent methyltransferase [Paracoccaceae bacterium]